MFISLFYLDLLSKEASQIKDTVTKKPVEDFSVNQSDPVTLEIRQKSKDPKLSSDNPESVHSSKKKKKKEKEKEEISEIDKEESFTEENLGFSVQNNLQTETKVAEKTHRGFRSTVIELHISEKDVRHDLNPLGENRSKRKKRNKSEKTVNDNTTPSSFISDNRGLSASSHCDAKLSINSNLPKDSEAAPKIKRKKSKRSDKETDESGVNKVSDVVEDCSKVEFRNTSEIEDKIISDLTSKRKKEKSLTGANSVGKKTKKDKKKLKHKESSFELAEGSKKRKLDSKHSRKLNKRTGVIKIETVKRKRKKEPNRSSDTGVGVLSSLHVDKHEFGEGSQISW